MSLQTVPMFPLPGLVLFPRTVLPLHIFEPRYYRMVTDLLKGDCRLAAANLRKGWETDYYGAPAVHRMVTVARVLHHESLPGRRYNILLEGIERAQIVEEIKQTPYRVVRVASAPDLMGDADREPIRAATRELTALAAQIATHQPELRDALTNLDNQHLHPGIIADQLAALLVRDAYERQSLLAQRRVLRRVELVSVQLRIRLADLIDGRPLEADPF
ncbi:MAG: LON peptidase substrate-binding domain-containing protein [Candidatus Sumerlaeia bacterium]|nr:LON peptidase substrate-binding domain-containing protein [Candidatus Sumerlaeia bacterium]